MPFSKLFRTRASNPKLLFYPPFSIVQAGFLFAIASAALFAIRPIFVKLVYAEGVDSTTLIALRMVFSLPIYIVLLVYFLRDKELRRRLNPKIVLQISMVGWFGYYFASFLDLIGLQFVTAQLGRMILYTYPTFVVLLGALFFAERITLRVGVSLSLTYAGIALLFGHDLNSYGPDVVRGALYITASSLSFAIYLLLGKGLIDQVGARLFTCIALISASIGILVHFFVSHRFEPVGLNSQSTLLILAIALLCTVIPTFFTTAAVARIGADRTGIVATVGPAFTSLAAVNVLGEAFTWYHTCGIALTVWGVWILRRR